MAQSNGSGGQGARAPWHLWVVGIIALLWNAMGAFDYVMTETRNASYAEDFSEEQLAYIYGFPAWVVAFWALAVWGGLLGAILLVARKALAVPVLLVSLICMVVTAIYNYGMSEGYEIMGTTGVVFTIVIFVLSLAFWAYARAMRRRGVLG